MLQFGVREAERLSCEWPSNSLSSRSVIALTTAGEARRCGPGPEQAAGGPQSWQDTCQHSGQFLAVENTSI